jgi:sortase (surface protein transpeptidase)
MTIFEDDGSTQVLPLPASNRRQLTSLPIWLRRPAKELAPRRAPSPRDARWWLGVLSVTIAILSLSFLGHVTIFGSFQESQSQAQLYQTLRGSLANATTPLGELDLNGKLVASGTPVALIKIKRLGLSQVIVQGTSSSALREGPGHRRDSVMPGQVGTSVIFGRQSTYGGPFGGLAMLVPGDKIQVTTGQGTSTFKVFGIRRPGDPLPVPTSSKEGRIELVTAMGPVLSPTGTLYVDAELVGTAKLAAAPVFTEAALDQGEGPMQTDPNALLPFLFALQWLVIAAGIVFWLARKWGRWQTWIVGLPVLLLLGATTADSAIGLLPNLL